MTTGKISDQVRGKTIRLTWTDGPTKGTAQDHMFHADGTVEWHVAGGDKKEKPASTDSGDKATKKAEKPAYAGVKITDDVCLISYLS